MQAEHYSEISDLLKADGRKRTLDEAATDMLSAYAKIYDNLVKAYANGTREVWIADSSVVDDGNNENVRTDSSGHTYRKLTKEEDLAALDEAYEAHVTLFQTITRNRKAIENIYKEQQKWYELIEQQKQRLYGRSDKDISRISKKLQSDKPNDDAWKTEEQKEREKQFVEQVDSLSEKMLKAAELFRKLYAVNQKNAFNQVPSLVSQVFGLS
jgi:hypothetical protein